jgi:ABC-2 type transport system ATP-binding protein
MTTLVEVRNLKKRYAPTKEHKDGFLAVKGISLNIERGEIFSLLGPNGAGKTTTISMMSGLLTPTEGDVLIGGHSVIREPLAVKRMIGVVPQEIALYPQLSARQNLEFFGRLYDLSGAELAKRCDEVLEFIGLRDRQKDKIETFSGGMKRRVNIGVGLLHKPALVFMDEPTVGVDPQSRRSILDAVKRLNSEGMTVLYTTHYMEEASELSNRVGVVDHGELIALGTEAELIQRIGENTTLRIVLPEGANRDHAANAVRSANGLIQTIVQTDTGLDILTKQGQTALPTVIRALGDAHILPQSIQITEPNLEAVFLHLTGRALRD